MVTLTLFNNVPEKGNMTVSFDDLIFVDFESKKKLRSLRKILFSLSYGKVIKKDKRFLWTKLSNIDAYRILEEIRSYDRRTEDSGISYRVNVNVNSLLFCLLVQKEDEDFYKTFFSTLMEGNKHQALGSGR